MTQATAYPSPEELDASDPCSGARGHREQSRALEAPFVSILINNYNYGRFVGEAIESALAQNYANREIVVVDDGSTDNSREVVGSYGDRVRLIAKENGGQASAFNAGFAACRGEIICLLDADDLFIAGKVERIVEIFAQHPGIGWCFENLRLFRHSRSERFTREGLFVGGEIDARRAMLGGTFPKNIESATSGLSFRRETLARILPMPHANSILLCDAYVRTACYALSPGVALDEELSLQRIHGSNLYTDVGTRDRRDTGRMNLLMGIYLQRQFPNCTKAAMKMLCRGCAILTVFGGWTPEYRREAWQNLRLMGPMMAAKSLARTAILILLEVLHVSRR